MREEKKGREYREDKKRDIKRNEIKIKGKIKVVKRLSFNV